MQIGATLVDHPFRLTQMIVILERCKRADLSDAVHIKRLSCFVKHLYQIGWPNRIADTQAGQPVNLRKRAENNNVSSFANKSQRIWRIIEEFEIGFVKNDDDPLRNM